MATDHSLNLSVTLQDLASAALKGINNKVGTLKNEFKAADKEAAKLSDSSSLLKNVLSGLGVTLAGLSVVNVFSGAVSSSIGFERQMSVIASVVNGTAAEMEALTAIAQEMGATTQFTATQSAQGLEVLARAGLSVNESISALPHVLDLAIANNMTMADSADIVTNVIRQMGLSFDETQRVTDVFQKTASTSNSTVEQLGLSFKYVGPIAHSMGLSIEKTSAILGQLHNQGIKADSAGTGLRQVLGLISDSSSKASKQLALLGITTKEPIEVIEQLAAKGKDAEKALSAFGLVASPAIRSLTSAVKENKDLFTDYVGVLNDVDGAAHKASKTISDNTQGAFTSLSSAWDALRQKLTEPILEVLTSHVLTLTEKIREFAASDDAIKFGQALAETIDELIANVSNFAAWIADSKDAILNLISVMSTMIQIRIALWLGSAATSFLALSASAATAAGSIKIIKGLLGSLSPIIGVAMVGKELVDWYIGSLDEEAQAKQRVVDKEYELAAARIKAANQAKQLDAYKIASAKIQAELADGAITAQEADKGLTLERVEAYKKLLEQSVKFYQDSNAGGELAKASLIKAKEALASFIPVYDQVKKEEVALGKVANANTEKLINSFSVMKEAGNSASEALKKITESLSVNVSVQNIQDVVFALKSLGDSGDVTAKQINEGLAKTLASLSSTELTEFRNNGIAAFQDIKGDSEALNIVIESGLRANLLQLGVDFESVQNGISKSGSATLANIQNIVDSSIATNDTLFTSFQAAVGKMSTESGLNELKAQLEATFKAGKITADQYALSLDAIQDKTFGLKQKNSALEASFAELGIKSSTTLKETANEARIAYEAIQQAQINGNATADDVSKAFVAYANKAIVANEGIVDSNIAIEASVLGVANKIKGLGDVSDSTTNKIAQNSNVSTQDILAIGDAAEQASAGFGGMDLATARAINELREFSEYAATDFTDKLNKAFSIVKPQSFNEYFSEANRIFESTKRQAEAQSNSLANYEKQLSNVDGLNIKQLDHIERTIGGFNLLNDSDLSRVKNQIDSVRSATDGLNNSIQNTLSGLQDELDRLNNNQIGIEQRAFQNKLIELENSLQSARRRGSQEAVAAARESLRLANIIHNKKMRDLKNEKVAAETPRERVETVTRVEKVRQDIELTLDSKLLTKSVIAEIKNGAFNWK